MTVSDIKAMLDDYDLMFVDSRYTASDRHYYRAALEAAFAAERGGHDYQPVAGLQVCKRCGMRSDPAEPKSCAVRMAELFDAERERIIAFIRNAVFGGELPTGDVDADRKLIALVQEIARAQKAERDAARARVGELERLLAETTAQCDRHAARVHDLANALQSIYPAVKKAFVDPVPRPQVYEGKTLQRYVNEVPPGAQVRIKAVMRDIIDAALAAAASSQPVPAREAGADEQETDADFCPHCGSRKRRERACCCSCEDFGYDPIARTDGGNDGE
jgi:hypothetical protein